MVPPTPPVLDPPRLSERALPVPRTGGVAGTLSVLLLTAAAVVVWGTTFAGGYLDNVPPDLVLVLTILPVVAPSLCAAAFLLWTIIPDHRAAPWLLAVTALAPVAWWGPSWRADGVDPRPDDLVVLTWNVQRLWGGPADGEPADAARCLVDTVQAEDPSVVVLQEVTAADLARLEPRLGLDCAHATYQGADDPGSAGIAVCSRGSAWTLARGRPLAYERSEDWRYLGGLIRGPSGVEIAVFGVHLRPYRLLHDPRAEDPGGLLTAASERAPEVTRAQGAQVEALVRRWLDTPQPTVIAGDFNSTRDTPFHARLRRYLVDAWEKGASGFGGTVELLDLIPLRVDFIYASPRLPVVSANIPDAGCSDHDPVVARLRLPGT